METNNNIEIVSASFRHSAALDQIFDALSKAQSEMAGALKDKRAQIKNDKANYSYTYSDLESVMEACRPALNKHGIAVVQPIATEANRVTVTTMLGHKSGQWIASDLEMVSGMSTPQAIGSTITYGRRYGLQSMAGVASEDDDGAAGSERNGSTHSEPAPQPRQTYQPRASQPPQPTSKPSAPPAASKPEPKPLRAQIADMERVIGATNWKRIMGAEGYETITEIPDKPIAERILGTMKLEAEKHGVNERDMAGVGA